MSVADGPRVGSGVTEIPDAEPEVRTLVFTPSSSCRWGSPEQRLMLSCESVGPHAGPLLPGKGLTAVPGRGTPRGCGLDPATGRPRSANAPGPDWPVQSACPSLGPRNPASLPFLETQPVFTEGLWDPKTLEDPALGSLLALWSGGEQGPGHRSASARLPRWPRVRGLTISPQLFLAFLLPARPTAAAAQGPGPCRPAGSCPGGQSPGTGL